MQKARRHPMRGSDRLQAHGFRYSFTPLSGVLFTFPSRYSSTIGLPGVLSLGGWCRRIRTGLLRPRPTQGTAWVGARSAYGAVTHSGPPFQACSATRASSLTAALQPRARLDARGLGWPPFARRYSGGHSCFPLLRLLGCFGSPGSPPPTGGCHALAWRVAPFGRPRISGCSRLPAAFRGLPRPSSPPGATGIPRAPSLACGAGFLPRPCPQPGRVARPPDWLSLRSSPRRHPHGPHMPYMPSICDNAITPSVCNACIHVRASHARRRVCVYVSSFLRPAALSRKPGRFPPMMSKNRPPDPRGTAWRMRESNPRPPACKAGALAI